MVSVINSKLSNPKSPWYIRCFKK